MRATGPPRPPRRAAPWIAGAVALAVGVVSVASRVLTRSGDDGTDTEVASGEVSTTVAPAPVRIATPVDGTTLGSGPVAVAAASDRRDGVVQVALVVDGLAVAESGALEDPVVWADPPAGEHELQLRVAYDDGTVTVSAPIRVVVADAAPPPTRPAPAPTTPVTRPAPPPTTAPERLTASSPLTIYGLGPLTVGSTVDAASAAAGHPIVLDDVFDSGCNHGEIVGGPPGASVLVEDGRVQRVQVYEGPVRTLSGIGIGSSEADVLREYPDNIVVRDHTYDPDGHELVFVPTSAEDADKRLVFETDGERVVAMRAGLLPAVEYVEGCA